MSLGVVLFRDRKQILQTRSAGLNTGALWAESEPSDSLNESLHCSFCTVD